MSIAEKLTTIAENEPKVFEAGKKAREDEFWNTIQNNGNATTYTRLFSNTHWTDSLFKPRHNLVMSAGANAFQENNVITAIDKKYDGSPLIIDMSLISTNTMTTRMFYKTTALKSIGTIIPRKETTWSQTFDVASKLTTIRFSDGVMEDGTDISASQNPENNKIGKAIDFSDCPLDVESIRSIINALYDYSGTSDTYVLTLGSVNLAKLTEGEKKTATDKGWSLA